MVGKYSVIVSLLYLKVSDWWYCYLDLPRLTSILLMRGAFCGDHSDDRQSIDQPPYNYKNSLIMRSWFAYWLILIDLPSLTIISGDDDNFAYIGSVVLESLVFVNCVF